MNVPFSSLVFLLVLSIDCGSPQEYSILRVSPSLKDWISKLVERALTALIPTPFKPTDFLKASESYFAPVLIFEEQSNSFSRGIPDRDPEP